MKGERKRPEASSIYVGHCHTKHVSRDMRLVRTLGQLSDRFHRGQDQVCTTICYMLHQSAFLCEPNDNFSARSYLIDAQYSFGSEHYQSLSALLVMSTTFMNSPRQW